MPNVTFHPSGKSAGVPVGATPVDAARLAEVSNGARSGVVDLVRSFAILAVLAHHLGFVHGPSAGNAFLDWVWYKWIFKGWLGVSAFFVVSGYLITRKLAEGPGGIHRPGLRRFYAARAGRILPLLGAVCLLGGLVVVLILPSVQGAWNYYRLPSESSSALMWFSIAAFWMNWYQVFVTGHIGIQWALFWSLAIEEQFYFLYPLSLRRFAGRRDLYLFLIFFVLLGHMGREAFFRFSPGYTLYEFWSFSGFEYIALGCLLYLISQDGRRYIVRNIRMFSCLSIIGLILMGAFYLRPFYKSDYWGRVWGPSLFGLGLFLFLLAGLQWKWPDSRLFRWGGMPGRLSYGMYLWHPLVLFLLGPLLGCLGVFGAYALFVSFTVGVAQISDRWFETPLNRWVRKKWGGESEAGSK